MFGFSVSPSRNPLKGLKTRDVGTPKFGVHGNQTVHMPIMKRIPELGRHPTWGGMWLSTFSAPWNAQSFLS